MRQSTEGKQMKIGLMHVTPYSKADPAIVAKRAEELGFESYWVGDHTIVPVTSSIEYPGVKDGGREPDYLWQLPAPPVIIAPRPRASAAIEVSSHISRISTRSS